MIRVLIGGQGSGKSLTSIHFLFELIDSPNGKVPRHTIYKRLITNVGGFKPALFKELSGNTDLEIIHQDKYWNKEDLVILFGEQMKERDKVESERTPTLFIYDECQFGLSTFSTAQANLETCEMISNFFSLQRHFGPCDFLLMTQSLDKIHDKYLGIDFELYISPEYALKADPANDIVFDLYDSDGKAIITGGRDKIKYKKQKTIKDKSGQEFNPFMLYVSGDGGRAPEVKKSYWKKYIYILLALVLVAILSLVFTFYKLFGGLGKAPPTVEHNTTQEANQTTQDNLSLPPINSVKGARGNLAINENSTYNEYVKEPYSNIEAQHMYRVFVMDNIYFIGTQILTLDQFKALIEKQVFFVVSTQPVTKRSFYVNLLIHQSVLNSFGLTRDFDTTDGTTRSKSTVKNSN
ncbi:MAG: Zonular occludens toxin (Zot) [Proteobacteria bacterium]|nr:Zonular occludens toxin (Zot) [Pseudomonadota bacterium]